MLHFNRRSNNHATDNTDGALVFADECVMLG